MTLFVPDLDRARQFYQDVFGLDAQPMGDGTAVLRFTDMYVFLHTAVAAPKTAARDPRRGAQGRRAVRHHRRRRGRGVLRAGRARGDAAQRPGGSSLGDADRHLRRSGRPHLGDRAGDTRRRQLRTHARGRAACRDPEGRAPVNSGQQFMIAWRGRLGRRAWWRRAAAMLAAPDSRTQWRTADWGPRKAGLTWRVRVDCVMCRHAVVMAAVVRGDCSDESSAGTAVERDRQRRTR
jgi:catechol 2,3-dioxygenase-like lactoylglutathione lyase family enzyme